MNTEREISDNNNNSFIIKSDALFGDLTMVK